MAESTNPLVAFSDHAAQLVERTGSSIVAVHGGGRGSSSGIHWRSGVIVTAEEVLEQDEDIKITLPGGRLVEASLAGRDPSTDVAVLRFQPDGLPAVATADAAAAAPGSRRPGSRKSRSRVRSPASASSPWWAGLGTVFAAALSTTSSAWILRSAQLPKAAPSSTHRDVSSAWPSWGRVAACSPFPRRQSTASSISSWRRVMFFGDILAPACSLCGAGARSHDTQPSSSGRGVLVVSIDPDGPAARAGLLVGDIVMTWNAKPIDRVREVMQFLGADSAGSTVDLGLIRGGAPTALKIVIGERPVA